MDWLSGIQNALNYIEEHLIEEIDYDKVAKEAACSSFYFQRIFSILCGMTLGDYIRKRRLTLAGNELKLANSKIIDIALKYGYESPESFTRAFSRFHGITPSEAKKEGSKLRSFSQNIRHFPYEGCLIVFLFPIQCRYFWIAYDIIISIICCHSFTVTINDLTIRNELTIKISTLCFNDHIRCF